jgi:4-amino-4-deoxy-L-arabinose transferase-like glycosyltransferase
VLEASEVGAGRIAEAVGDLRKRGGLSAAIVAVGIAAGLVLRVWVLASTSLGTLDSDEGVWGTMARQALHGHFYVFFWGQRYGGTQEVLLSAPFVAILGSTPLAIRIVPIALWGVAAILVWRIGRRLLGEPAARFAAVLFWLWPAYFVWKSTRAHGFYGSTLVLGLAVLLLALRLRERRSRRDLVLLGLALGCGLWASPQVAILAVPAVVWLVASRPRILASALPVVIGFVVGASPWIVANVRGGFDSLNAGVPRANGFANLHNLAVATTPTALGLRVPFSLQWVGGRYVGPLLYAAVLVGLLLLLVRGRRSLAVAAVTFALFPLLYYLSPYAYVNVEPRYLTMLSPIFALVAGSAMTTPRRAVVVLVCALALSITGLAIMDARGLARPSDTPEGVVVPADFGPLVRVLDENGVTGAYAGYWVAWRLTYSTGGRIVGATTGEGHPVIRDGRVDPNDEDFGRDPSLYRKVHADRNAAHVFIAGGVFEARVGGLLRRVGYRRIPVGGFIVYLPPRTTNATGP